MTKAFTGDLYYIDPAGYSWKITQRASANNATQYYWHADRMHGDKAHRVSASMHRLLIGLDEMGESGHDGDTQTGQENTDESPSETECLHPKHPEACKYPEDLENRRQAYLG